MDAPPFDLDEFVRAAQEDLVRVDPKNTGQWERVVERGYLEAYRQRDFDGLASMVNLVLSLLDARGQFDDCLQEIEHAKTVARGDPDAIVALDAMQASFLFAKGRFTEAVGKAAYVMQMTGISPPSPRLWQAKVLAQSVRLQALEDIPNERIDVAFAAEAAILDRDALFLSSWYIPYLFARGERRRARPLIRMMKLRAQMVTHGWREADAASFSLADEAATSGCSTSLPDMSETVGANPIASRRAAILSLHQIVFSQRWEARAAAEEVLLQTQRTYESVDFGDSASFSAAIRAHRGEPPQASPPPDHPTLSNLSSALAAAEAVAYAGSQAEAIVWHDWLSSRVPDFVQTSLEWPIGRRRIEGLLAVRAGRKQVVTRCLQEAVRWSSAEGYRLEQLLSQLQLAEWMAQGPGRSSAGRGEAWLAIRNLGIDPAIHAYALSQGMMQTISGDIIPKLSAREAQVLALLAGGASYREAAAKLGIQWPTVQTLAHRAYEKLGVSGRIKAVAVAKELGIL